MPLPAHIHYLDPGQRPASTEPPDSLPHSLFRMFNHLPIEIRYMIWELCLPHRVVALCRETVSTHFPRIPLIAQVCHEARQVALMGGAGWTELDSILLKRTEPAAMRSLEPSLRGCFQQNVSRVWFDPRRDTVCINPHEDIDFVDPYLNRDSRYLRGVDHGLCLRKQEGALGQRLSQGKLEVGDGKLPISVYHTSPFRTLTGRLITRPPGDLICGLVEMEQTAKFIAHLGGCQVVVQNIALDLTHEQACETGLFGLFAEETTTYIDLDNQQQMDKLFAAYWLENPLPTTQWWTPCCDLKVVSRYQTCGKDLVPWLNPNYMHSHETAAMNRKKRDFREALRKRSGLQQSAVDAIEIRFVVAVHLFAKLPAEYQTEVTSDRLLILENQRLRCHLQGDDAVSRIARGFGHGCWICKPHTTPW